MLQIVNSNHTITTHLLFAAVEVVRGYISAPLGRIRLGGVGVLVFSLVPFPASCT